MAKILIIRFSSIGDIVLTTPVLRCLKEQVPHAEIHYLTKGIFEPLISLNPYIDKVYTISTKVGKIIPQLQKENYDYIIDLHKNFRSIYTIMALRKPFRSFPKLNFRKWLYVSFKINLLPDIHIVERYLSAAGKFNVVYDGQGLDYYIPAVKEVNINTLPKAHHHGYVLIALGGMHNTKQIPENIIVDICRHMSLPVVLAGGKTEFRKAENIIRQTGDMCFNACGHFSINQTASLIRQSMVVISADTGLMHIAAALKKPVVSLWGNTVPSFGMSAFFPDNLKSLSEIIEIKGLSCRPCSKLGKKRCPKGHFNCMNQIDASVVAKKVNTLLGK